MTILFWNGQQLPLPTAPSARVLCQDFFFCFADVEFVKGIESQVEVISIIRHEQQNECRVSLV